MNFNSYLRSYFERHGAKELPGKIQMILTLIMQASFLGAFFIALFNKEWMILFVSIIAMVAVWFPMLFAKSQRVRIPIEFEFILTFFLYGSIFLGEIHGFYTKFWWWDMVLHGSSGVALGFIGFLILYSLYRNKKLDARPSILGLFSFAFALALGALWEILEFAIDSLFGFNMQKNGLRDTMFDLVIDAGGALLMALSGYLYLRYRKRGVGILEYYLTAYFRRNKG